MSYSGELAAIATALCWTCCAVAFTEAGKRVGSRAVNVIRIVMALGLFVVYEWIVRGLPLPTDAPAHTWGWLGLSGLIGFTIGDLCIFRAFLVIGTRPTMLIMALAPPMTAVLDLAFRAEGLTWPAWVGMAVTLAGVCWVILESDTTTGERRWRYSMRGLLLALAGAVCQAVGNVMSAEGMELPGGMKYDGFASAQIRAIASVAGFVALFAVLGWWPRVFKALHDRKAMALTSIGAVLGPFLGVALLMVAFQLTQPGIAATIVATTPVLVIPFSVYLHKETITARAVVGAVLAVAGVAMLMFDESIGRWVFG